MNWVCWLGWILLAWVALSMLVGLAFFLRRSRSEDYPHEIGDGE